MSIDRWDLVDGTILTTTDGHRGMIDGMAGPYLKVVDAGGSTPLPSPLGWMSIGAAELVEHINAGNWSIESVRVSSLPEEEQ